MKRALFLDCFVWSLFLQSVIIILGLDMAPWGQVAVFAGGLVLAVAQSLVRLGGIGQRLFTTEAGRPVKWPQLWLWLLLLTLSLMTLASGVISGFSIVEFFNIEGLRGALRIFSGLFSPDTLVLNEAFGKMRETIYMSFLATILFLPLSFFASFLVARNLVHSRFGWGVYVALRMLLNMVRSMEVLVWAIIFSVWVGIGPFAGVLALSLHSAVSLTKQFSELIEEIDLAPLESLQTIGARRLQVLTFGVVPQVFLPFIGFAIYRWDINLRMATVVGLVGGGGIGTLLIKYVGLGQWHELGTLVLLIALSVWVMDFISAWIREALK